MSIPFHVLASRSAKSVIKSETSRLVPALFALLLLMVFGLSGCGADAPVREYVFARSAMQAAKTHEAQRLASGPYSRAEEAFKAGERLYADESYSKAKTQFIVTKKYAEKAEIEARVQKMKSGEAP